MPIRYWIAFSLYAVQIGAWLLLAYQLIFKGDGHISFDSIFRRGNGLIQLGCLLGLAALWKFSGTYPGMAPFLILGIAGVVVAVLDLLKVF